MPPFVAKCLFVSAVAVPILATAQGTNAERLANALLQATFWSLSHPTEASLINSCLSDADEPKRRYACCVLKECAPRGDCTIGTLISKSSMVCDVHAATGASEELSAATVDAVIASMKASNATSPSSVDTRGGQLPTHAADDFVSAATTALPDGRRGEYPFREFGTGRLMVLMSNGSGLYGLAVADLPPDKRVILMGDGHLIRFVAALSTLRDGEHHLGHIADHAGFDAFTQTIVDKLSDKSSIELRGGKYWTLDGRFNAYMAQRMFDYSASAASDKPQTRQVR